MTLPEIRAELLELAVELDCPRLSELAMETLRHRNSYPRKARSKPLTPTLRAEIRQIHSLRPDLTQLAIANMVGVNPGRVSEVLYGRRK